jgi:hypothetical protein
VPTITTTSLCGYRITSSSVQSNGYIPATTTSGTTGSLFYTATYDNTGSLASNQELMIANGSIRSCDSTYFKSYLATNNYLYSGTNKNNLDYTLGTTISSAAGTYRYITFAWQVSSLVASYSNLNFVLNNVSYMSSNTNYLYADSTNQFLLFYKIDDTNSGNALSTYWVSYTKDSITGTSQSANGTNKNSITSGTPYYAGTVAITPNYNNGTNSNNILVNITLPLTFTSSTTGVYVYARLGLPMFNTSAPFSLQSISAFLS